MAAKLTIIFFILICFEIGLLLTILPWLGYPNWGENYLLFLLADKLPGVSKFMASGFVRGAVSGLGLLNIWIGVMEIINFNKTVQFFQSEIQGKEVDSRIFETPALLDNRQTITPAEKE
ncbi:MAG: hypothetical protein AB1757_30615 [Acidobacteriota bacterium]